MLILIGDKYVNPAHIVEVVVHPSGKFVCVILTNGKEVRIERPSCESNEASLARVANYIKTKAARP